MGAPRRSFNHRPVDRFRGPADLPAAANAAELTADITNPRVTLGFDPEGQNQEVDQDTKISVDNQLTFHAEWTISAAAKAGDTFMVPLPQTFRMASSQKFDLRDDDGTAVASCQYTLGDTDLACAIVGGPYASVNGNIWFSGKLNYRDGVDEGNPEWQVGIDDRAAYPSAGRPPAVPARVRHSQAPGRQGDPRRWRPAVLGRLHVAGLRGEHRHLRDGLCGQHPAHLHRSGQTARWMHPALCCCATTGSSTSRPATGRR